MGRIEEAIRRAQIDHDDVIRRSPSSNATSLFDEPAANPDTRRAHDSGGIPVLARHLNDVDSQHLFEKRVIAAAEDDERVGPYRQLRTQLLKSMRDNHWTTLAITSAREGAGKTLTSVNLGISLSKDVNTKVLLVDLDLRTPTMHDVLGLIPEKGIVDYLEGNAELEEIVFDPGLPRLTILAGRSAGKYRSELLGSPRMKELMRDLCDQQEGNITIFDLPPLLRNDDALLFAPYADATLIVVEDGVTTEDQLRESMRLLEKANIIGTILNKARV